MKATSSLITILWQLYSDAVTRINLLTEECGHIQSTIVGSLPHAEPAAFGWGAQRPTDERPWIPDPEQVRGHDYYHTRAHERALRNLYVNIGCIATALDENAKNLREAYRDVVANHTESTRDDSVYWFISLRGHLYSGVFPRYLRALQHAQEKLIHLLENSNRALPSPTLLRRWSSGRYGEFLSDYARQVNIQIQLLMWEFCKPAGQSADEASNEAAFIKWRSQFFLVHNWSHNQTSMTDRWPVDTTIGGKPKRPNAITIWSSYFYLEQPVLFPLLYHECAHHYNERLLISEDEPVDRRTEKNRSLWFQRAREAASLLNHYAPIEEGNLTFWNQLVDELWADAVSLSRCGEGYLAALILQLVGLQQEHKVFSDFDVAADTPIPLTDIGKPDRRTLNVPYPALDLGYFWVARIRFAIRTYSELLPREAPDEATPWSAAAMELIKAWDESGASAMSARVASSDHAALWAYQYRLNVWVNEVVWSCLADFVKALIPNTRSHETRNEQFLSEPIRNVIKRDIEGYQGRYFQPPETFDASRLTRIESICSRVRWWAAQPIQAALSLQNITSGAGRAEFDKWTIDYINHLYCDGAVAFRMAMDWLACAQDIAATAARLITDPQALTAAASLSDDERVFVCRIVRAARYDFVKMRRAEGLDRANRALANLARRKFYMNQTDWPHLTDVILRFSGRLETLLDGMGRNAAPCSSNGMDDGAGSFTLGVVRPMHFARSGGYGPGMAAAKSHFDELERLRKEKAAQFPPTNPSATGETEWSHFIPLLGEFNFAVYQPGLVSNNRQFRLRGQPPSVLKTRMVLKLGKGIIPTGSQYITRITQATYQYRWQWVLQAERLSGLADVYLSSAAEHLIIVSRHASMDEYRDFEQRFLLRPRTWLDTHTNVGLSDLPLPVSTPVGGGVDEWKEAGGRMVTRATGRYDEAITWKARDPKELWESFCRVSMKRWRQVDAVTTSMTAGLRSTRFSSQVSWRHW